MDLATVLTLLAKNGKDIEHIVMKVGGIGPLLEMVPSIIGIISTITADAHNNAQQGIGMQEAAAQAFAAADRDLKNAVVARTNADTRHAADPTDGAFDKDFERHEGA